MPNMSRRDFLQKSSVAVGAAGVVAAVPAVAGSAGAAPAIKTDELARTAVSAGAPNATNRTKGSQVVVRVRDVDTGEIDVFVDTRRVAVRDRRLAAAIAQAGR